MGCEWLRIDVSALDGQAGEVARTLVQAADDAARAVRVGPVLFYPFSDCEAARLLLHERYGLPLSSMSVVSDL